MSEHTHTDLVPIPSWPAYAATHDGRILAISTNWRGYGARELLPDTDSYGYPSVRLTLDKGKRKRVRVHRLVAEAFLGPKPSPGFEICHINGDQTDNRAANLKWGTRQENADDRAQHGRTSSGERHSKAIKAGIRAAIARARGEG